MKKALILFVSLIIILGLFFVKTYTSSPGFVTEEDAQKFYSNVPQCKGFSFVINKNRRIADVPDRSICIVILR